MTKSADLRPDLSVLGTTVIMDDEHESDAPKSNNFALVATPEHRPGRWSQGRKWLHLARVGLYTATTLGAECMYSFYEPLTIVMPLTLADLNGGIRYLYLCIGLFGVVRQPMALAVGKCPVYVSCLMCHYDHLPVLGHQSQGNEEWIGCCIVNGFVTAPLFMLLESSISDIASKVLAYPSVLLPRAGTPYGHLGRDAVCCCSPHPAPQRVNLYWDRMACTSGKCGVRTSCSQAQYMAGGFCLISALVLIVFLEETNYRRETSEAHTPLAVVTEDVTKDDSKVSTAMHIEAADEDKAHSHPRVVTRRTASLRPGQALSHGRLSFSLLTQAASGYGESCTRSCFVGTPSCYGVASCSA
jgi:hypothetical protein